jgi:hypothetical protein
MGIFTEVILRNPLFQDLDPTILGLPWDLHVVFLTRETGKQITWAGIIIQSRQTSESVDDLDLVNGVNRRRETLKEITGA